MRNFDFKKKIAVILLSFEQIADNNRLIASSN